MLAHRRGRKPVDSSSPSDSDFTDTRILLSPSQHACHLLEYSQQQHVSPVPSSTGIQVHQSMVFTLNGLQTIAVSYNCIQQQPSTFFPTTFMQHPNLNAMYDPVMETHQSNDALPVIYSPEGSNLMTPRFDLSGQQPRDDGRSIILRAPHAPSLHLPPTIVPQPTDSSTVSLPVDTPSTIGTHQTTTGQWHVCEGGCGGFGCNFNVTEDLPFDHVKPRGHGRYGLVQEVRSTASGTCFATKEMNCSFYFDKDAEARIRQEVSTHLRVQQHRHISKIVGSYLVENHGNRTFGIVMSPLADCDLKCFLGRVQWKRDSNKEFADDCALLIDSIGCLASGLAYLHSQSVKHKDMKPENILVYQGTVLLTDFGLAHDFSETGHSTSSGPTSCTKKFAAPEIHKNKPRSRSADIFSLGCIYVEIFAVLAACSLQHNGIQGFYGSNISGITSWVGVISKKVDGGSRYFLSNVVEFMLSENAARRPTALDIWTAVVSWPQTQITNGRRFCGPCCMVNPF